ncbi:MAG: helix-turn-helix domain-containing protein [Actinomycetota bacterium]|nr:helix-turn-helix domain-containing protein [Actinomycetota bacterium]
MTTTATQPERARIVAVARRLVERDGPDALSMRKLAADLGVAHTAIYWHVGGRDELIGAIVDSFIADLGEVRPRGRSPRTRMESIALDVHRQAVEHRALVSLAFEQGRATALWQPAHVALAREVEAAGLRGAAAARAVQTILYLAGAFVTLEAALEEHAETRAAVALSRRVFSDALEAVLDQLEGK